MIEEKIEQYLKEGILNDSKFMIPWAKFFINEISPLYKKYKKFPIGGRLIFKLKLDGIISHQMAREFCKNSILNQLYKESIKNEKCANSPQMHLL